MRNTLMLEGNIKEAIKQRVNELGTRKNIPYILIKAPQSDIMPAQKPCPAKGQKESKGCTKYHKTHKNSLAVAKFKQKPRN